MGQEIERKFLVKGEAWRDMAEPVAYRQGYIARSDGRTVRVRKAGETGYLTVKGPSVGKRGGTARAEFEYEIPVADADEMLDTLCEGPLIEKTRRKIPAGAFTWEVDEFAGANAGLVVAEVELQDAAQEVPLPDWIGEEVTGDARYFNASLVTHPFKDW